MTGEEILAIEMENNDSGTNTICGYLVALLKKLWEEGDGFSGKRPFGNSGWEYDLYKSLVKAGYVKGKFDEFDDLSDFDSQECNKLIFKAIESLSTS